MTMKPLPGTERAETEISDSSWRSLDHLLGSTLFPSLREFNLRIDDLTKDEFVSRAKEEGWLTNCFERGIVRYGEERDWDDMMCQWGFSRYPDRTL
ncbi:hypothetical protein K474DRAFT_1664826 [Panus rudis PR-1116 ss-1]|nr:hypothetical protein K474DRAFT_1664826 [Panus rudis PR-1116 ss-1]